MNLSAVNANDEWKSNSLPIIESSSIEGISWISLVQRYFRHAWQRFACPLAVRSLEFQILEFEASLPDSK